ncbi:hypothetical protein VNO80_15528 [Phaseolus coccineus]|uniref:Cytochrome P450 n=1 Tax=Phaseolus coccineus TaxID=3886 RepID=A0AAN9MKG5_PHACN
MNIHIKKISSVKSSSWNKELFCKILAWRLKLHPQNNLFGKIMIDVRPQPTPPSLPIIGHLHLVVSVLPKSFQALACCYGPLIQLRLGASTCVVVSNAQVAKKVMKTHDHNFCYRPQFGSLHNYLYKGSAFITIPYGPYWHFIKKL